MTSFEIPDELADIGLSHIHQEEVSDMRHNQALDHQH